MTKRYLDTTVFTYGILYDDEKARKSKEFVKQIAKKIFLGISSTITWDEVFYTVKKTLGKEIAIEEGKKFLELPNLLLLKLDKDILLKAQELTEKYSIDPRDAIHAATAIIHNAIEIVSDDSDFDKIKEIKRIPLEKCTDIWEEDEKR